MLRSIVLNCTLPPCCRPGAEGSPKNSGGPNIIMQHPMHLHGHHFWVSGTVRVVAATTRCSGPFPLPLDCACMQW